MSQVEHISPAQAAAPSTEQAEPSPPELSHFGLFWRFLKFGTFAFGGPVAQIAMIRRELVDEERWISRDRFNKLLAVMQVLPGPEAHELCVHLGMRAKGRVGGLLAGLGFMLPGFVLMLLLAWVYTRLPIAGTFLGAAFLGVQAAVVAVIARAVHRIGEHILLDPWLWAAAIITALASIAGVTFWIVLPAAGIGYALAVSRRYVLAGGVLVAVAIAAAAAYAGAGPDQAVTTVTRGPAPTTFALFIAGLKGGLLTFGGAYTALPFVRADTVGRGWMSDAQFLDGLGLSGILPAPLVIFATFVGWICGGLPGALATTVGMFLPAFGFSLVLYERLETIVEHHRLQLVLTGIAASVVGFIVVTLLDLGRTTAAKTPNLAISALIFIGALVLLYRWKSKLATPVALAIGAGIGLVGLQ